VALVNVTAIVVTRGDVDLSPIFDSFIAAGFGEGQVYVWDNSKLEDLAVYGRYAAIEHAKTDLIYVQDDDVVLHHGSIEAIINAWLQGANYGIEGPPRTVTFVPVGVAARDVVVCNMPANFRARHFYDEHSLVGFGACFHRDAPRRAFGRWADYIWTQDGSAPDELHPTGEFFHRTCDIVFTGLTPRVLVDVPYDDLPWASADNRMWKQPTHQEERSRMLELVLKVRDG
jgi:hypothetical protein